MQRYIFKSKTECVCITEPATDKALSLDSKKVTFRHAAISRKPVLANESRARTQEDSKGQSLVSWKGVSTQQTIK
eukprot:485015-Amphidinium_carterae.1